MVISKLKKEIESIIGIHDARLLITGLLSVSNTDYVINKEMDIAQPQAEELISKAKKIASGEPLQYVVGTTEFMSLEFKVEPGVLIPRPDTETLVEAAINYIGDKNLRVLDIGSGSGCVAISIAHYCKNAEVTSIDISPQALAIAKDNRELNNAEVQFMLCDIMNDYPKGKFDVIVSNPPYIPTNDISELDTNVKDFEPLTALDGGKDGLDFYRRIISIAPELLSDDGKIYFEVGHDQADAVAELMSKDFKNIKKIKDLCGIERVVCGQI